MYETDMIIRPLLDTDVKAVVELWRKCNLIRPWNDPLKDIERKLQVDRELFLVGVIWDNIVATVMGGYEGHRGWVNYLAVEPGYQRQGLGRQMMQTLEKMLKDRGCPKVNLQIRADNSPAIEFYKSIGYNVEDAASLGKRLIED